MSIYQIVSDRKEPNYAVRSPADAFRALERYKNKRNEHFFVITLSAAHEVIAVRIVSIGLLNKTVVHPREIFIHAIRDNSAAVICVHNHPSGSLSPSEEDINITKRLRDAGELLGIPMLDHLIISKNGYYSMVENGYLTAIASS
ncbi:MAG: DNA repair protein RadC [Spirochaetes bacterium GWB1_59_5]|nr:MAG: DNA repair protein RadC [Spirochaetes bacterium GWB1_59_5]